MKTLEQLLEEIKGSDELKKELAESIKSREGVEEFLKKNNCEATAKEAKAFLQAKGEELKESGELSPEELEAAAGGSDLVVTAAIVYGVLTAGTAGIIGWALADSNGEC